MKDIKYRRFIYGSKAETLKRLQPLLTISQVPPFLYFLVSEWKKEPESIVQEIRSKFTCDKVIVRSSANSEDHTLSSQAGQHDSILNVGPQDKKLLRKSIDFVINSYEKSRLNDEEKDQVIIQQMVENVSMSGVLFTQDMNTGAPYYVTNYDDETGRTDTVTSGGEYSNRTLMVHREALNDLKSERFKVLFQAVEEIEKATNSCALDIEFALDKDNNVFILQLRQITTQPNWNRGISLQINDAIHGLRSFLKERQKSVTDVYGPRLVLGQMSDWNPAEMIGATPRPLALSLYRNLITDRAWRVAREQMGYSMPVGGRLMVSLYGRPYIDVRLSFYSFLPADLSHKIGSKLINGWIDRLSEHRELHDKVEFDVAITALTFDFEEIICENYPDLLSQKEKDDFKESLFLLTSNLISGKVASLEGELQKIKCLEKRHKYTLEKLEYPDLMICAGLLEDCIELGTIPFSILARHAFIAHSFLRSLVRKGVIDDADVNAFKSSIKTIAKELVIDMDGLSDGKLEISKFMETYGFLRPGTYDILSLRYDQMEEFISGLVPKPEKRTHDEIFNFTQRQIQDIERLLNDFGYGITPEGLISYIKKAIAAREYAKFVFTRNISDALEIIALWGERLGLSRDELSYLSIDEILDAMVVVLGRTLEQRLRDKSLEGRKNHEITTAIHLPYIITDYSDVSVIPFLLNWPNFITQKTVKAPHVFLGSHDEDPPDISEKIVLIEGADPGFDWIFSRPLVGLVTKYGGANSHMAIRCAEFGLPAAIGCGEQIFDKILRNQVLELNCSEKKLVPLEGH